MAHEKRARAENGKMNAIGERVKERVEAMGLTHGQLAGRIASLSEGRWIPDRQAVVMVISGTRTVTDVELILLASALETTVARLVVKEQPS